MINGFIELTIQSKINDSDGDEAETDPISDTKVTTYTTNGKSPQKSFNNRFIPKTTTCAIRTIDQLVTDDATEI